MLNALATIADFATALACRALGHKRQVVAMTQPNRGRRLEWHMCRRCGRVWQVAQRDDGLSPLWETIADGMITEDKIANKDAPDV
jgi:hypothetical protein